jgi:hypothetical protein
MINLLLFITILFSNISKNDDIEKYQKAYNYILDSNSIIIDRFWGDDIIKPDSFSIYVSPRLYFIDKLFFTTDIIDYEFNCLDEKAKRKVQRLIILDEYGSIDKHLNDSDYVYKNELNMLNKTSSYDLKLFFAKIDEYGRLRAELIYYSNYENYLDAYRESGRGISYLFYFNNNKIENVIILKWIR